MQVIDHNFRGTLSFGNDVLDVNLRPTSHCAPGLSRRHSDGGHQVAGDSKRHTFQNSHGFYLQDSFRATPRLTLNYGVRWDYFGVIGEKNSLFYTVVPNSALAELDSVPTKPVQPGLNNFAPRVAFAYDLTGKGKTVVRGGWGLFYDAFSQDMFLGHLPGTACFVPARRIQVLDRKRSRLDRRAEFGLDSRTAGVLRIRRRGRLLHG